MSSRTSTVPKSSALSDLISKYNPHGSSSPISSIIPEVLYNLQYQHGWTDLKFHNFPSKIGLDHNGSYHSPIASENITLISGIPPRHSYVHPDLQSYLIKHNSSESTIQIQREWVLPMASGEQWTLQQFSKVFDSLPQRDTIQKINNSNGQPKSGESKAGFDLDWQDSKRVLLGMLAHNGRGGDGTIVYYIMQEGEVKPRQNG